jgi:hypothetical protein
VEEPYVRDPHGLAGADQRRVGVEIVLLAGQEVIDAQVVETRARSSARALQTAKPPEVSASMLRTPPCKARFTGSPMSSSR